MRFIYFITQSTQVLEDCPVVKIISDKRKKVKFFLQFCAFKIMQILKILKFLVSSGLNQICNLAELISLNYLSIVKIEQSSMDSHI